MKKVIALLLALVMGLALCGCGINESFAFTLFSIITDEYFTDRENVEKKMARLIQDDEFEDVAISYI